MNVLTYILRLEDRMTSTLSRIGASTHSTTQDVRELKGEVNGLNKVNLGGFFSSIKKIVPAIGVGAIVGKTIRMGMEQEMRNTSFEVLFGGVDNAKKVIDEISSYAAKSPYGKEELSEATQTMAGFSIAQEKIMPNLKMIGDIAMGNKWKFLSLTLAFSQMSSAGRLMGQDLLQMINAGFNPLQIMAENLSKKTGKSVVKSYGILRDQMEKGLITSEMATRAFQQATSVGGKYYDMVNKINSTVSGQWAKATDDMKEKLLDLYFNVIQPIVLPALKQFNQFLSDPIGNIEKLRNKITSEFPIMTAAIVGTTGAVIAHKLAIMSLSGLQAIIKGIKSVLIAYELVVFAVKNATSKWAGVQWILNEAMGANKIWIVIGAVVALIEIIALAWNKFEGFRGVVTGLWETFKLFVKFLKDAVMNTIMGMVDTFSGLGKIIKGIFKLDWESVKEGAKEASSGYVRGFMGGGAMMSAMENGKKVGDTWSKGYQKGVANTSRFDPIGWASGKLSKFGISKAAIPGTETPVNGTGSATGGVAGSGNSGISGAGRETANSIATGGTKSTNIQITIGEMGNDMKIYVDSVKEGAANIRNMILDEITRALTMAQGQI